MYDANLIKMLKISVTYSSINQVKFSEDLNLIWYFGRVVTPTMKLHLWGSLGPLW